MIQAIALSLAEYSEKPVTALGAETSSTVTGASESTPHKNNSKASVQDSAKNKKIKKLVRPFKLELYQFHLCHVCFTHSFFPPRVRAGFSWQKMMWLHSSSHLTVLLSDTKIHFLHVWPIKCVKYCSLFQDLVKYKILLSAMNSIFMKCNELKVTWFESTLF